MPFEVNEEKLIHWLQELIRIPSPTGEEGDIAQYVLSELQKMGFDPLCRVNNVYFEVGEGERSLLLNAHLDTVDVSGQWTHDPFGAIFEDGKIFGRGASDDKGNIAVMLEIARLVRNRRLNGRLIFTFSTGEEFGTELEAKGSYMLAQMLKAEKALVLEPQTDVAEKRANIIYGCRGIENMLVRIHGKASHTGYPERGINALSKAAELLTSLGKSNFYRVSASGQEIETICMPLRIQGGGDVFLVPDTCEIVIHCRTAPGDQKIGQQVEDACRKVCGENFEIKTTYSASGYIENPSDRLVDILTREAIRHGYSTEKRFAGGRIDASIFKSVGNIPSFCTGAGNRDQMHLVDEYITVDNFITCAEMLKDVVFAYLS